MNKQLLLAVATLVAGPLAAQPLIPLYEPGKIILATNNSETPRLTVFKPAYNGAGIGVILCSGGSYGGRANSVEGFPAAQKLAQAGITAFVLDYRVPSADRMERKEIVPLTDAQRALQYVREHAAEYQLHPRKIGIMGFSAGGHLASTVATQFNTTILPNPLGTSLRPDFQVLIYPVVSFADSLTHIESRQHLIGPDITPERIKAYSAEWQVTDDTPPAYITSGLDDRLVKVANSLNYAAALRQKHVPVELFLYEKGPHGYGAHNRLATAQWIDDCIQWLKKNWGTTAFRQPRWTAQKAAAWYKQQPWLVGANFTPSTAINQLDMWQAETFDSATISRELGWARSIGMNVMRVFLHHAAWQQDPAGFKARVTRYLAIAQRHGIKTIFVLFDDCWRDTYTTGKQPEPVTGRHNSGWLKDPGNRVQYNQPLMDTLETYVKDIMTTFRNDTRILLWDLYNEPGQFGQHDKSMPLLQAVFRWAREVNPTQPISAAMHDDANWALNQVMIDNSDIITYHSYDSVPGHSRRIDSLQQLAPGRPLICTEYMARKRGSTFQSILPLLKAKKVGAINWGLVDGKTQTKYAWDDPMPNGGEPALWFHDVFRKDGTPYKPEETNFIQQITKQ